VFLKNIQIKVIWIQFTFKHLVFFSEFHIAASLIINHINLFVFSLCVCVICMCIYIITYVICIINVYVTMHFFAVLGIKPRSCPCWVSAVPLSCIPTLGIRDKIITCSYLNLLCTTWPETYNHTACAFPVLGSQACALTPDTV
jgi:hypothetical protein